MKPLIWFLIVVPPAVIAIFTLAMCKAASKPIPIQQTEEGQQ